MYNLIYLKNRLVVNSRKFVDFHEIQESYDEYVTNFSFESLEELILYLKTEYSISNDFENTLETALSELEKDGDVFIESFLN